MISVAVLDINKNQVKDIELKAQIFNAPVKEELFYEVVKNRLANKRTGSASTKGRSEIRGSNSKPWKQKGTGRARAGTKKSPIWRGGGVVFGPHPRDYSYKIPKGLRKKALKGALTYKLTNGELIIIDDLKVQEVKTKELYNRLKTLELLDSLIVINERDRLIQLSARNIKGISVTLVGRLNVYEILKHKNLIIMEPALKSIEEVLK